MATLSQKVQVERTITVSIEEVEEILCLYFKKDFAKSKIEWKLSNARPRFPVQVTIATSDEDTLPEEDIIIPEE